MPERQCNSCRRKLRFQKFIYFSSKVTSNCGKFFVEFTVMRIQAYNKQIYNKHQRNTSNMDNERLSVKIQNYLDRKFDEIGLFGLLSVWAVCVVILLAFVAFLCHVFLVMAMWFDNLLIGKADIDALLEKDEML